MSTKQAGVVSCKQVVVMSTLSAVPGSSQDARAHEAAKRATQTPRRTRLRVISNKEERCGKDNESFTQRKKTMRKKKSGRCGCTEENQDACEKRERTVWSGEGCGGCRQGVSPVCAVQCVGGDMHTHMHTHMCKKKRKTKRLTDAGHLPDPRKRSWRYRHLSPAGQQSPRAQYRQHTSWCVTPSLSCACACGCG